MNETLYRTNVTGLKLHGVLSYAKRKYGKHTHIFGRRQEDGTYNVYRVI